MRVRKEALLGTIGILALLVAASPRVVADTAAYEEPPLELLAPSKAKLVADRHYGFAPMTVTLAGMLEAPDGDLQPFDRGQQVLLVVDSPFLHVSNSAGSRAIASDFHYEATMTGPATPAAFVKAVELKRPGRYVFSIQVLDHDGQVLRSNEVTIKAM